MKIKKKWLIIFFIAFAIMDSCANYNNKSDYYLKVLSGSGNKKVALEWLGLLKEPRAIPYIAKLLRQKEQKEYEKVPAIECLGKIGHRDGIIPIVELIIRDESDYETELGIETLGKIDPKWMNGQDIKSYIPRCISLIKQKLKTTNLYDYTPTFALVKFLNETDPQKAIPIDIEIINKSDKFDIKTLEVVSNFLNSTNFNRKDVQEGLKPLLKTIFNLILLEYKLERERYFKVLNKLYPGWENTDLFNKNLLLALNKISKETEKNDLEKIAAIDNIEMLAPYSLGPVLEKIITNPKADEDLKMKAISVLSEIAPKKYFKLFISGLTDKNVNVRIAYIMALGQSQNIKAIPYLSDLAKNDFDSQQAAIVAIGQMNARESIPYLVNLAAHQENPQLVLLAIEALSAINPNPPIDEISKIFLKYIPLLDKEEIGLMCLIVSKFDHPEIQKNIMKFYPLVPVKFPFNYIGYDKFHFIEKLSHYKFSNGPSFQNYNNLLLRLFQQEIENPDAKIRACAEYGIFNLSR